MKPQLMGYDKLLIQRPVSNTAGFLGKDSGWEDTKTVNAYLSRNTGRRSEEVGEHFADYDAEFYVYRPVKVEDNWRVVHTTIHNGEKVTYTYIVVAITPHTDPLLKILHCNRFNP